ncbi:hypothetical protein FSARC_10122 [Fusarium sarcochroum]|uniref:Uncharacterized protein n=1 Tax=Fusarium sarcochroum TaxID=1208366 RepID=A0A8H4TPR9_9HYPO|nr:hypothetical protein FSARC_10122 [Fusarium sarcochroum]
MDGVLASFAKCETSRRVDDPVYRNSFLLRLRRPLDECGSIPYSGYVRALHLYGNETAFELSEQERANFLSCKNLNMCRSLARNQGYNPESGRTAPWEGVYFPSGHITTYPGPMITTLNADSEQTSLKTSEDIGPSLIDFIDEEPAKIKDVASDIPISPRPVPQFNDSTKPETLRGMSGNRVPDADDFGSTCVGGMEMAVVVTELLERVVEGNLDEWRGTIKETLEYIGGSENMAAFLDTMYKNFPKKEDDSSNSVASTVGLRLRGL